VYREREKEREREENQRENKVFFEKLSSRQKIKNKIK
jgi:hypothetical protein